MVPQTSATTPTQTPPGRVTPPRVEIPHHLLRMAEAGIIARVAVALAPSGFRRWEIKIDGKPAPEAAVWGIAALDEWGLIGWHPEGGREIALPTPDGADTLARWDAELFGADGPDVVLPDGGAS